MLPSFRIAYILLQTYLIQHIRIKLSRNAKYVGHAARMEDNETQ
jgi:hypothetical protein